MATAEEYAAWIVANQDKKGTPEFETVSSAYQMAKQGGGTTRGPVREFGRQMGLTARYGMEAFGQTALPDIVGLPKPETDLEKDVGGASRLLIQALPIARGAQYASQATKATSPLLSSILKPLGLFDETAAVSAAGAGAAAEQAKNENYGPTGQFIAALVGGLVTAPGGGLIRGADDAAVALKNAISGGVRPTDIETTVQIALRNAGMDWGALSTEARIQLVRDAADSVQSGQPLNPDSVRRLADFRNIGATPLRGDVTQDPGAITRQRNLSKRQANVDNPIGPNISQITNENAGRVISTLDNVAESPLDTIATGQRIIQSVQADDAARKAGVDALYADARSAAGRDIPLNRSQFVSQAFDNLEQSGRVPFLPGEVRTILNGISDGTYPFNVQTIDNLKTILASASRGAKDGNTKAAIGAVREALENVQPVTAKVPTTGKELVTQETAAAMRFGDSLPGPTLEKFDKARAASKSRFDWQESSGFIEDALNGATPDKFVQKHVINSPVEELAALRQQIAGDQETMQAVRRQLVEYVASRGNVNAESRTFSSAGMEKAFRQIGDRKWQMFFSQEELQQLRSAINVARYMQAQPIGSAVNNSNTGGMLLGFLDRIWKGASVTPLVGPAIVDPVNRAAIGFQARGMAPAGGMFSGPPMLVPTPERAPVPYSPLAAFAISPRRDDDKGR